MKTSLLFLTFFLIFPVLSMEKESPLKQEKRFVFFKKRSSSRGNRKFEEIMKAIYGDGPRGKLLIIRTPFGIIYGDGNASQDRISQAIETFFRNILLELKKK